MRADPDQVERFLMEEWIARRLNSPYVAKSFMPDRRRNYLYTVMEFIEGQNLKQWMRDHPEPDLQTVRGLVEQVAWGLRAFHRMEMIHQDLRPDNVMIDATGTVKLIDFGSTRVAGLEEAWTEGSEPMLGTLQYSAPEYFLGEVGTPGSDIFSLGVITYQMLTGRLPYGTEVAQARTRLAQYRLRYYSARRYNQALPGWIDGPLRKALHPDPNKRYQALSEYLFDLQHARGDSAVAPGKPLIERHPLCFWKGVSLILAVVVVVLSVLLLR
jgi:serine/threonine protein kinase